MLKIQTLFLGGDDYIYAAIVRDWSLKREWLEAQPSLNEVLNPCYSLPVALAVTSSLLMLQSFGDISFQGQMMPGLLSDGHGSLTRISS